MRSNGKISNKLEMILGADARKMLDVSLNLNVSFSDTQQNNKSK